MLGSVRLFAHSVRHTRPQQLVARTSLELRRRAHQLTRGLTSRPADVQVHGAAARSAAPPSPILPRRSSLVNADGGRLTVSLAGRRWPLDQPVDWHPAGLDALQRFNLHYMEYLEGVGNRAFEALVLDWIEKNPPYHHAYWRDSWSAFTLSLRTVVWMQEDVRRGSGLAERVRTIIERSVVQQIRFLERNLEQDLGGNHLLKNIKALLWAGRFFTGPMAARWRALGERLLEHELAEQILADGFHFERSPAYHVQVFADLLECREVLPPGPLADRLASVLHQMAQVVADTTHPDGHTSLFNDGGLHMAYAPAHVLGAYARATGHYVQPRRAFAFEDAGYFGLRGADSLLLADCGRIAPDHLPAHGHGDILSFEWSVRGQRVIVDPGVFEYNEGDWRAYARGTRAHNTVTVDGADQCEFWKAFRVGRRANVVLHRHSTDDGIVLEGSHDGYARLVGAPVHRRLLKADEGRVIVHDVISGGVGQPVVSRLLVHPSLHVRRTSAGCEISNRRLTVFLDTPHRVSIDGAWWCPDFNVRIPTQQIVMRYGPAPCDGRFELRYRP